jgi:aspartyl-tRNA(Asn)/glutamyl-tRNA(Gln) amidotransferase subunit C
MNGGGRPVALTREEVEHIARLARLGLTDAELETFRAQLSQILEYFQELGRIETEGVPPTAHPLPLQNVIAPDEVRPSLPTEEVLANAPLREDDFFRVRKVLE